MLPRPRCLLSLEFAWQAARRQAPDAAGAKHHLNLILPYPSIPPCHPHQVVELDQLADGSSVQDAIGQVTGRRTVPQASPDRPAEHPLPACQVAGGGVCGV